MGRGLIIVFTGEGKGKTTAALGIALRAAGHRMFVTMVQFIKSSVNTGEARAAERLAPNFEMQTLGKGFVNGPGRTLPLEAHKKAAGEALAEAGRRMCAGSWNVVILDEINNAVQLGLLAVDDVLGLLRRKPAALHVILTGRNAHPSIVDMADLVTEMKDIKHPYREGIGAQQGIDY